jgi:hypothetical protein
MKKHYYGLLFSKNMWAAAKCFTVEKYNYHMRKIEEKAPDALAWLDDNHPFVWTRSKFSEESKVDYINNNLSKCFNSWISILKDQQSVDILDKIWTMLITKFVDRYKIASNMVGTIIPSIIEHSNATRKEIKDHGKWVHVAVAKTTGWGAPAQGSIPGCYTIYSNLWHGTHLFVTIVATPFG